MYNLAPLDNQAIHQHSCTRIRRRDAQEHRNDHASRKETHHTHTQIKGYTALQTSLPAHQKHALQVLPPYRGFFSITRPVNMLNHFLRVSARITTDYHASYRSYSHAMYRPSTTIPRITDISSPITKFCSRARVRTIDTLKNTRTMSNSAANHALMQHTTQQRTETRAHVGTSWALHAHSPHMYKHWRIHRRHGREHKNFHQTLQPFVHWYRPRTNNHVHPRAHG